MRRQLHCHGKAQIIRRRKTNVPVEENGCWWFLLHNVAEGCCRGARSLACRPSPIRKLHLPSRVRVHQAIWSEFPVTGICHSLSNRGAIVMPVIRFVSPALDPHAREPGKAQDQGETRQKHATPACLLLQMSLVNSCKPVVWQATGPPLISSSVAEFRPIQQSHLTIEPFLPDSQSMPSCRPAVL